MRRAEDHRSAGSAGIQMQGAGGFEHTARFDERGSASRRESTRNRLRQRAGEGITADRQNIMYGQERALSLSETGTLNRRRALAILGGAAGSWAAQARAEGSPLPLHTSGLEHIGMTVPDQEATAKFYGMIFDPQL